MVYIILYVIKNRICYLFWLVAINFLISHVLTNWDGSLFFLPHDYLYFMYWFYLLIIYTIFLLANSYYLIHLFCIPNLTHHQFYISISITSLIILSYHSHSFYIYHYFFHHYLFSNVSFHFFHPLFHFFSYPFNLFQIY